MQEALGPTGLRLLATGHWPEWRALAARAARAARVEGEGEWREWEAGLKVSSVAQAGGGGARREGSKSALLRRPSSARSPCLGGAFRRVLV